jgi:hypothetical protein
MARVKLADIPGVRARSGDKGDIVDVALFAADDRSYETLRREVTAERVAAHFATRVRGTVTRYELPRLRALKYVLTEALDGGASRSLRSDNLGKCFAASLLRMEIDMEETPA